jgi:two-component system osmolarity sensor histidine kinase EnvZ
MRLSLFIRALITLILSFGLFALLAFATVVQFALVPVADRGTRDLAALMVLATKTLARIDEAERESYRDLIARDYGLRLLPPGQDPKGLSDYYFPYLDLLQQALAERTGASVVTASSWQAGERWFWVRLAVQERDLWIGFPRERVQSRPFEGLTLVIMIALVLIIGSAALLARRVTKPLERLSAAAEQVAQGFSPRPLPETGPRELACLARQFNHMSRQVRELLANRTLLLAGISHDLRTPLTRLRLALEMLPRDAAWRDLTERMERDLEEMNGLLDQAAELGRSLGRGEPRWVDLAPLIGDLCQGNPRLRREGPESCHRLLDPLVVRRILGNLIENALSYSAGEVEVRLDCRPPTEIRVMDRGTGIPAAELEAVFRPFYRLESSRSRATGGSGLGLAVCQQLAQANGFQLRLAPRPGGGLVARLGLGGEPARTAGGPSPAMNLVDATDGTA